MPTWPPWAAGGGGGGAGTVVGLGGGRVAQALNARASPSSMGIRYGDVRFLMAEPDNGLLALLGHARALVGVTLADLADAMGLPVPVGTVRTKGWPGQIIE